MTRTLMLTPLFALAAPALAFGPGPGHEPTPEEREAHLEKAFEAVDATPEQRSAIRVFIEDTAPELKGLHEEGRQLREELHEVFLYSETVDRSEVELLRVDAVDLFDRATSTMMDLVVDVSNVLTMDQRQTLHELKQERHQRIADRIEAFRERRAE